MNYTNSFVSETASVTLDIDFMIDSHVIRAGTNLLRLDSSTSGTPYELTEEEFDTYVYIYEIRVKFDETIINRLHFPLDEYTFRTSVELENGKRVVSDGVRTIHIE